MTFAVAQQVRNTDDSGPLTGVSALSLGASHTCALTTTGTALCWGSDVVGQLGIGGPGSNRTLPVPVQNENGTGPLSGVESITTGSQHTCAQLTSGEARCWGEGVEGQLGQGVAADSGLPVAVLDPSGTQPLQGVTAVTAGDAHTCALTDVRTVLCWGANWDQQLGRNADPTLIQTVPDYVLPGTG